MTERASHIRIGVGEGLQGDLGCRQGVTSGIKSFPTEPASAPITDSQCATLTATNTNEANRKLDRRRGAALAGDGF